MNERKIIHIDMDAFYASIEQRDRPSLKGKPLVVGHPRAERAVVAAASYEARRWGIHSAMSMVRAYQICPDLVAIKPDFAKYKQASATLHELIEEYTDQIEPLSLDECYLDVTHDLQGIGSATWIAQRLRQRVREELGVTASAGAAPVKFVAKLASDHHKPDGLCVVPPEYLLEFIHPQPVERLWGVGPVTAQTLHEMRLYRIKDVARCDPRRLERRLGSKGRQLWEFAHGRDDRPVRTNRVRKSRGIERTFNEDLCRTDEILEVATAQLHELARQLSGAGEQARCITLKLKFDDHEQVTRSFSVTEATSRPDRWAHQLPNLIARTEAGARAVRLVGVTLSGLVRPGEHAHNGQLSFEW